MALIDLGSFLFDLVLVVLVVVLLSTCCCGIFYLYDKVKMEERKEKKEQLQSVQMNNLPSSRTVSRQTSSSTVKLPIDLDPSQLGNGQIKGGVNTQKPCGNARVHGLSGSENDYNSYGTPINPSLNNLVDIKI